VASTSRLVVRTYTPLRRLLLVAAVVIVSVLALFTAFEWGRSNAGFDGRAARAESGELRARVRALEREVRDRRLQLASRESERVGQTRERTELAKTIGDLQAEVARLTSDLGFYRGVVGDKGPAEVLKIQQFRVVRTPDANEFIVKVVLGRPLRPDDAVSGKLRMTFEGTTAATPANLDLAAVSDVKGGELSFSYRYLESIEQKIRLPAGFAPARTTVEIALTRKGANPVRETFLWSVDND
jgi:hypothetical protein